MHLRLFQTLIAMALICGAPARADAQQEQEQERDRWRFSTVPLYFWAPVLDGEMSAGPVTRPLFLKFADAVDNVGGAFSFHFEAARGRWGLLTDLDFLQLSTESTFTVAGRTIEGEFEVDNIIFELGGSFLINENRGFGLVGGLRTYTASPKVEFRTADAEAVPIDTSRTSPNAFVGFIFRPRINDRWAFFSRADIGAGDADLTWSGVVGFDFRVASWGSLEFGYKALGIDVTSDDQTVNEYDVTHYGPIVAFRIHRGR